MTTAVRRAALALVVAIVAAAVATFVFGGFSVYVVHTGSMVPTYHPGDAIIDRSQQGGYRVGQVISFGSDAGPDAVITHRVHDVQAAGIHTQGDANTTPDTWTVAPASVKGVAVLDIPLAGYAIVYLQQPTGVVSLLCLIIAVALAWRIYFPAQEAMPQLRVRHS
jgi:signal peptidase I